jgi:DNA invertase Pin-like site-specific DNA recombinase
MRVIGYARVSTDEQASEGVSMAAPFACHSFFDFL